ncbi:hypothetical protein I302_108192 [Kwoniella bestiolae CBS 10118]|uniref:UDENN domain-containing protein n=1 Tax=Kwoniella bestiolae CBS 10118 TaxID=1296100 RepID=A0A1B9FWG1_9TREE|nr:hypothetical protein I302_07442 [Kwoniella bestiolae CBS 10118]OCF23091.1 hypothetical protein I302_07442 [Kwoniella bestiolae CBS 10118]
MSRQIPLNDEDSGDISLSSSHFTSQPQPQPPRRPSSSSDQTLQPDSRPRSHSRERDVSAPSQRLFGRSLFTRSPQPQSQDAGPSVPSPTPPNNGVGVGIVNLNDDSDPLSLSAPGPSSSSRPVSSDGRDRLFPSRRTSSGLGRSRSLNVKLPSLNTNIPHRSGPNSSIMSSSTSAAQIHSTPSSKLGWSRRPGEPRPPPLVGDATSRKMGRWVKEVVVCNFDLERGPVVERRAGDRRWGPGEKENVAFSSFPDTSLFSEGSILFSFKIRHIPPDPSSLAQPEPPSPMPDRVVKTVEEEMIDLKVGDPPEEADALPGGSGNGISTPIPAPGTTKPGDKAEEYRKWDERGREWLYGFVWFEQRRDKGITRGYMQKSLVILTHLPFPALFSAVLQKVAPVFFEYGYSALEAACHSIASWPDPTPDSVLELPMLTDLINVKLPDTTESPQIGKAFGLTSPTLKQPILAALPTSTPLRAFASFLPSLWSLWECLILAEPVLIIAPDPKTCSEIVWWLRELLRPIPPAGDFRPYLHIHDHDFSLLVNSNKPQAGVVVGVTNPFFRNAASHWPNVISIPSQRIRRVVQNGTGPATTGVASPGMKDQPEGFLSRRHRSVQKDRVLLKRLEGLVAEGNLDDSEGNEALRTHFQQLTERFLVPLNRYFQTLVPTLSSTPNIPVSGPNTPSPLSSAPAQHTAGVIKPFSLPNFLTHLRNHGPNPLLFKTKGLSTKSRVENDFYASFCMSSSFAKWLENRVHSLGLALTNNTNTNNTLNVPGRPSTPSRAGAVQRPNLPRSVSASVGLGILGGLPSDGRISPTSVAPSESEISESSSTRPSVDVEMEGGGRQQREREGSGNTIIPGTQNRNELGGWFDTGRRASEGMVKFTGRDSVGR